MLPAAMPDLSGLDVAAATRPATAAGGDDDAMPGMDDGLLVALGDATGHGLAAGIVVTAAEAQLASLDPGIPPRELLSSCHRALAAMPPLLVHRATTGEVEEVGSGGLPLGGRTEGCYAERTTPSPTVTPSSSRATASPN